MEQKRLGDGKADAPLKGGQEEKIRAQWEDKSNRF